MKSAINFTTVTPNFRGRLLLLIRNSGIMLITFLGWTDASYVPGTDYGDLKIIHRGLSLQQVHAYTRVPRPVMMSFGISFDDYSVSGD